MANIPNEPKGNVNIPQLDDKIEWVTADEAEKLDKLLFKNFVRKTELKSGDRKKFFYRVTGACPYVPLHHNGREVLAGTNQNLIEFTVDKFHRNEFVKSRRRESGQEIEEEINKPVSRNEYDEKMGTWEMVDQDTGFKIDSRKFLEEFVRDTE